MKTKLSILMLFLLTVTVTAQQMPCQSQLTEDCKGQKVTVNGIEMYFEIHGEGPPLLVLHGGTGFIESFGNQIVPLAQHFTVIAPDSRAHGRTSDGDQPLSYTLMADDFKQLLDHLGIEKTHVLGWSDGGTTGITMAINTPEYVDKLAVIGSNYHIDGVLPEMKLAIEHMTVNDLDPRVSGFYRQNSPTPDNIEQFWNKVKTMWLTYPKMSIEQLESIQSPTLVIAGANEDFIQESHTRKMASSIPNARLELIPEGTHYVPLEQPERVTQLLMEFFTED